MTNPKYIEYPTGSFASNVINLDYFTAISLGVISGASTLRGFGSRTNISNVATGDDIWPVASETTIPIPSSTGEKMQVVSTSVQDGVAGTGALTIQIVYLDASGNTQTENKTMNGITPVPTIATNIRFVQEIYVLTAGTGLLAAGIITISKFGAPATIYNQINVNTNQSLSTARMVPAGKKLLITAFSASGGAAAGGKSADVRLRATSHDSTLLPRLYHFIDNMEIFNSAMNHPFIPPEVVPALAIVKMTAYDTTGGADIQGSWEGILLSS